jgi:hypothetical protein
VEDAYGPLRYREGGKVKNRTLANLSSWPEAKVETLARALKGLPPAGLEDMIKVTRSLPHGHVAAVLGHDPRAGAEGADQSDRVAAAGPGHRDGRRRGDRRILHARSLGGLLGLEACDEDDLYQAMDWLLPRQQAIEDALAARHCATARWCCMTCPARRSRAGPARWARSATPGTGCGAGCRSSTAC